MSIDLNSSFYTGATTLLNDSKYAKSFSSNNFEKPSRLKEEDYVIKLENFSFDRVQTEQIQKGSAIFQNNYSRIFDDRISVDDVRNIGIGGDTQSEYETIIKGDGTGIIYGTGKTFDEQMQDTAEKYDLLAKQIYEKHGTNTVRFNKEMGFLNDAFKRQNVGTLNNMNRETFDFLEKDLASKVNENSQTFMGEYTEKFLNSYDVTKNADFSKVTKDLLKESLPAETTSISSISYKDYEILSNTKSSYFNRGTGFEMMQELAKNKDLSSVIRNEFKRVVATGSPVGLLVDVSKLTNNSRLRSAYNNTSASDFGFTLNTKL